jgi:hypothetical protein
MMTTLTPRRARSFRRGTASSGGSSLRLDGLIAQVMSIAVLFLFVFCSRIQLCFVELHPLISDALDMFSSANMRVLCTLVTIAALAQFGSAQSCVPGLTSCFSCISDSSKRWCSDSKSSQSFSSSGCCISAAYSCNSQYPYGFYSTCNSPDTYLNRQACDSVCIIINVVYAVIWIANMVCVIQFCRRHNIEPCGFIVLAIFFSVFVWCCLASRSRQQIVVVQANVPYQVQPGAYAPQQYGQPSYGQPYGGQQGAYVAPSQPSNAYAYGQQGAYVPPSQGGAPPNPYAQPPNPYGEISKPQ